MITLILKNIKIYMMSKIYNTDGTSEDSEGRDSSFTYNDGESDDEEEEKEEEEELKETENNKINLKTKQKPLSTIEELNIKQKKFQELLKTTNQKKEEAAKKSSWSALYYTFFNKYSKKNYISLNEIILRCKLISKIDQLDKDSQRAKSEPKEYVNKPLTNLNEFINYFCNKKFPSVNRKLIERDIKYNIKDNNNINNGNKNNIKKKIKENFVVEKENRNIFKLYGIKKPLDAINKIIKDERKNNYNSQNKRKNFDMLFSNKKIYEQEIDNFLKMSKDDPDSGRIFDEFLDFKSNENFLNDNIGVDLIATYGRKLGEQEKFGAHLNNFYDKVTQKIDPLQKLDEFNVI